MVMNVQELKWAQETFKTGHFWTPDNKDLWNVNYADLLSMEFTHPKIRKAIQSRTQSQVFPYAEMAVKAHGRLPNFDGERGQLLMSC